MIDSKPTASTLIGVLPIGISCVSATKVPSATIANLPQNSLRDADCSLV
jgi:hypothetical protein